MNFLQLDKDSYWINSIRKIENKEKERKLSIMILGKWRKNETTLWILVTFNISLQECKNHGHVWNIITTKFYDLRHKPRNYSLHTNVLSFTTFVCQKAGVMKILTFHLSFNQSKTSAGVSIKDPFCDWLKDSRRMLFMLHQLKVFRIGSY